MTTNLKQQALQYKQQRKTFFWQKERGIPIYEAYYFSGRERIAYIGVSLGIVLFFAFFFYRSMWAVLFLWPAGIYGYLSFQQEKGNKRRQKLEQEFKDCILSVAANLRAGYSVENAFAECIPDMVSLYGEEGLMLKELYKIKKGLGNNIPLEKLLQEFGIRSGCNHIREFGEVLSIARQSGGKMPEIIQSTAGLIGEEISLKQEIQAAVSGRLLELKIMMLMPFLLVCYIEIGNRGFFDVLYHDFFGGLIMTGCLAVYLTAYRLAVRICKRIA